jgi:hypothetical protein
MNTPRNLEASARPAVRPATTAKVLACASLSLAITLATMLTIGNTAATHLFAGAAEAAQSATSTVALIAQR